MQQAEIVEKWVINFSSRELVALVQLAYIEQANIYIGGGNRIVVPYNTREEALEAAKAQLTALLYRIDVQIAVDSNTVFDLS